MGFHTPRKSSVLVLIALMGGSLAAPVGAPAQVRTEAYLGTPFGVGRVELDLPPYVPPEVPVSGAGVKLRDQDGRVLYPAIADRPVLGLLRDVLDRPQRAEIYFLFQGDGPLELTAQAQSSRTFAVTPRLNSRAYDRLLATWWREYTPLPRLLRHQPDYPPMVENYLAQVKEQLGLIAATEEIRVAIQRDRMRGRGTQSQPADQPLPPVADLPELAVPEPDPNVEIDPIALHVPAECFYVRFGSFSNFLWVQDTLEQWGGDFKNLIASRGVDYGVAEQIESQLVVKQTALARLLGDTVIADVAIIGTDFFIQEGGSFGLMFHARKNNMFLAADIKRQRQERVQKGDGVADETIVLAGREVSFLSSPDGSVRSFYVADGEFHFVTTSETLARRFIEAGSGKGALGTTNGFRHARTLLPLDRGDTVFVYLSDEFLRNLLGPRFHLEMVRRMQALADIELVQMAVLAAAAEGKPGGTIKDLVRGGFLPPNFGPRPDGSRTVLDDGDVYDSLRGRRGTLLPIADVEVTQVSRAEADAYREFVDFYESNWGRLDPILAAIKRHAVAGGRERIVADVRLSPFAAGHFEILKQYAGMPDTLRLAPIPEDKVAFEMVLPTYRLFGGLEDFRPPLEVLGGTIALTGRLRDTLVGYMGSSGDVSFLSWFDRRLGGLVDAAGFSPARLGLWRRQWGEFTVYSFQPDVLASVVPRLRFEEGERPAQLRVRVEDLSQGRFAALLNDVAYARTRETSEGNIRLMESLAQQFHVPGEHCKEAAELLLGTKLICPLGGQYVYGRTSGGVGYWTSTALAEGQPGGLFTARAPQGYQAPPMNWFRGLNLDVLLVPEALVAHAEILMQEP